MNYHFKNYQWIGRRDTQQDFLFSQSFIPITSEFSISLIGVFDGVGGNLHGELASSFAGMNLQNLFSEEMEYLHGRDKSVEEVLPELAFDLMNEANRRLSTFRRRLVRAGFASEALPATTGVIALLDNEGNFAAAQMGDSLVFLGDSESQVHHLLMNPHNACHDSEFRQLNPDIPESEAITRFLGQDELGPEVKQHLLNCGNSLALMSDGAWEVWDQAGRPFELEAFFEDKSDPDFNDNASVVLVKAVREGIEFDSKKVYRNLLPDRQGTDGESEESPTPKKSKARKVKA